MKGFPKGFKPRRGKVRFPVPPPGFPHETPKEYDRNDWKEEVRQQIDEAIKEDKKR